MDLTSEIAHLLNNRKFLDYFRQRNIIPTTAWKTSNDFEYLAEFQANQMGDLGEYIYYFMNEIDKLVIWSDKANVLNLSFSRSGNVSLVAHVTAPPFFVLLSHASVGTFFAKGFTDPTADATDSLYISEGKLVYSSHKKQRRTADIYYYYMDRRGM